MIPIVPRGLIDHMVAESSIRRSVDPDHLIDSLRPAALPRPLFTPAPAPAQVVDGPLKFGDPADLFLFANEGIMPYGWQTESQMMLAGVNPGSDIRLVPTVDDPILFNLVAANGSGKDHTLIAAFAAWFCCTKMNSKCVITSSGYDQLKTQTFYHLSNLCNKINNLCGEQIFEIVEFYITCPRTKSVIKMFVSDDPAKVEGQHSHEGGEFAVIINEAKSIKEDIFTAVDRFTGWNYWIMVSSSGTMSGRFYRTCTTAPTSYPGPLVLGVNYVRKILAKDCPHLMRGPRIQNIIANHGTNSLLYRTSVMSEFFSDDQLSIIPSSALIYPPPAKDTFGLPPRAGLDIGLGGDATVLFVLQGNHIVGMERTYVPDAGRLHVLLIQWFRKYRLEAENITGDFGGIGRPIIQRLWESDWNINKINNEGSPLSKKEFLNRGAEIWYKTKRAIEEHLLVLPIVEHGEVEDIVLRNELVTRQQEVSNGKIKLESKKDMKSRGIDSPNYADAFVLANTFLDLNDIRAEPLAPRQAQKVLTPVDLDGMSESELTAMFGRSKYTPTWKTSPPATTFYADDNNSEMKGLLCP